MNFNKPFKWNEDKNQEIFSCHGLRFEMLLKIKPSVYIPKHNPAKYPRQDAFLYFIDGYPVFVPFVEEDEYIFIKNMIPKREYKYLLSGGQNK